MRNCRSLPSVCRIALGIQISRSNRTEKKTVMLRLLDTIFSYVFRLQWPMNTVNCRSLIEHTSSIPNIFSDVVFCNHFKVAIRNQSIFCYHYCFWAFKKSFCKVKLFVLWTGLVEQIPKNVYPIKNTAKALLRILYNAMKTFDKNRNHWCVCYIQMQSNIEVDVGKKPGKKVGDTSTEMVSMSRFFFFLAILFPCAFS